MKRQTIATLGGSAACRSTAFRTFKSAATAAVVILAVSTTGIARADQNQQPTQSVNVVNTPTVTISGTPTVKATVANTASNPVPSLDLAKVSRIPYESTKQPFSTCTSVGVYNCDFFWPLPPAGFRLVVENVSGYLQLASNATAPPLAFFVDDDAGKGTIWAFMGALGQLQGTATPASINQTTRAVFDSGDTGGVNMTVTANWSGSVQQFMTLSGYLENCAVTGCPPKAH
jgi:hypothetical protein